MLDELIAVRIDLHSALHLLRTDVNESRLCLVRVVDTIDDAVRDIMQPIGLAETVNPNARNGIR